MDEDPSIYVLCCLFLISNFEAFRLFNLELFEALLLIKKLLVKTGFVYPIYVKWQKNCRLPYFVLFINC